MKTCPACSEEILDTAKKCKHCNEWLTAPSRASSADDGSAMAKAVMKGMKQKEWHDFSLGMRGVGAIVLASAIGYGTKSVGVGLISFLIMGYLIRRRYYKE